MAITTLVLGLGSFMIPVYCEYIYIHMSYMHTYIHTYIHTYDMYI